MTRKDYVLIANTIAEVYEDCDCMPDLQDGVRAVADKLCINLAQENPSFKPETFLSACKVNS